MNERITNIDIRKIFECSKPTALKIMKRIWKEKNLTKGRITKNDIKKRFYIDI